GPLLTESKIAVHVPAALAFRDQFGRAPGEEIRKGRSGPDSKPGAGVRSGLDGLQVSRPSHTDCLGAQSFGSNRQGPIRRQTDYYRRLYGMVRMVQRDGCQDLEPYRRHRTKRKICLPEAERLDGTGWRSLTEEIRRRELSDRSSAGFPGCGVRTAGRIFA